MRAAWEVKERSGGKDAHNKSMYKVSQNTVEALLEKHISQWGLHYNTVKHNNKREINELFKKQTSVSHTANQ